MDSYRKNYNRYRRCDVRWSQEMTLTLINLVKENECLWNINCDSYTLRGMKEKAWKEIEHKLNVAENEPLNKWNCLRTNLRKALKMEKRSNGISVSKSPYVVAMNFLLPVLRTEPRKRKLNIKDDLSQGSVVQAISSDESTQKTDLVKMEDPLAIVEEESDEEMNSNQSTMPAKVINDPQVDVLQKSSEVWAFKLREMDRHQSIIAEKLINEVIFYGQLDQLDLESIIVNLRQESPKGRYSNKDNA